MKCHLYLAYCLQGFRIQMGCSSTSIGVTQNRNRNGVMAVRLPFQSPLRWGKRLTGGTQFVVLGSQVRVLLRGLVSVSWMPACMCAHVERGV
jgi:hypothetical protein